jgi:hypothetical protein
LGRLPTGATAGRFHLGEDRGQSLILYLGESWDGSQGEIDHAVQLRATEAPLFSCPLNLDHFRSGGGHHIHVDLGRLILGGVEIEQRLTADNADRDGCYLTDKGPPLQITLEKSRSDSLHGGDVCTRDARSARPTIGLQDITVEGKGVIGKTFQIQYRP